MTVLTVMAADEGAKRVMQLKTWTESQAHLGRRDTFQDLFWFTDPARATSEAIFTEPIWEVAGAEGVIPLLE